MGARAYPVEVHFYRYSNSKRETPGDKPVRTEAALRLRRSEIFGDVILRDVSCMPENDFNFEDDGRYYTELAAAFVRGKIGGAGNLSPEELIGLGRARGLRLHKVREFAGEIHCGRREARRRESASSRSSRPGPLGVSKSCGNRWRIVTSFTANGSTQSTRSFTRRCLITFSRLTCWTLKRANFFY